jgi:hypothetical protein
MVGREDIDNSNKGRNQCVRRPLFTSSLTIYAERENKPKDKYRELNPSMFDMRNCPKPRSHVN